MAFPLLGNESSGEDIRDESVEGTFDPRGIFEGNDSACKGWNKQHPKSCGY
jgi:hypothetical protein